MGRVRSFREAIGRRSPVGESFPEVDGTSREMARLKEHMARVARDRDVTVLILGESGTGKERVARAIHRASPRRALPFVVIDCAALAATLAEDQLFGHVRGAFTGAFDDHLSPFERANGGAVLLDEVGDLPLDLQMKLLRAVQSRAVLRLGSRQETPFDVRLIASTNVDLARAVGEGRFRQDLYYRLKVYEIVVPPLRARGSADLAALAASILARLSERRHRTSPGLGCEAFNALARHDWPGNVRELENVLERTLVAAGDEAMLTMEHLPDGFGRSREVATTEAQRRFPEPAEALEALQRNGSRFGRTAAELGLSRHQLYRLLKRHGLRP